MQRLESEKRLSAMTGVFFPILVFLESNVDFPKNVTSGTFDKVDIAAHVFGLLICSIAAMNQRTNRQT
jgi:membrane associated rhomboid family serine protease